MLSRMIITTREADLSMASAGGAVPATISYKGILTDASGTPVKTTTSAVFTIYDQPMLGSVKWTETCDFTSDAEGRFAVLLGRSTPLQANIVETSPLYLAANIGDGDGATPRAVIASAPSARLSDVLKIEPAGVINRVVEVLPSGSVSVMGVRDPGGDIGGVLPDGLISVQGVRDPGGDIDRAEPDGSISVQGVRDPGGDLDAAKKAL